jgi:hypothetical protein
VTQYSEPDPQTPAARPAPRCPWCDAHERQSRYGAVVGYDRRGAGQAPAWWGIGRQAEGLRLSFCGECGRYAVWHEEGLLWPHTTGAPRAHHDMPAAVRADFDEARAVFERSPRAAAALLRLVLRRLCRELGLPGERTDDDLAALVRAGLPAPLVTMLREAHAAGGEAVPPGVLDQSDSRATALNLFAVLNGIVDRLIGESHAWRPH